MRIEQPRIEHPLQFRRPRAGRGEARLRRRGIRRGRGAVDALGPSEAGGPVVAEPLRHAAGAAESDRAIASREASKQAGIAARVFGGGGYLDSAGVRIRLSEGK